MMMEDKKRMMFLLEDDYYYLTIKILIILHSYQLTTKYLIDFRKLSLIIELLKNESNFHLIQKRLNNNANITIFDSEQLTKMFCNINLNLSVIQRILFFLCNKEIIELSKNIDKGTVDLRLTSNGTIKEIFNDSSFKRDTDKLKDIKRIFPQLISMKYDTMMKKIFE